MAGKFDAQQWVTDRIVAAIEAGTPPWRQPWTGAAGGVAFPTRACGEPYRGINVILLWLEAHEKGYVSPIWFTYRQAQALGGQVRAGEKSARVIKFGTFETSGETGDAAAGGGSARDPYTKLYAVFSADQIDGLPGIIINERTRLAISAPGLIPRWKPFFAATGAVIESTPDPRAWYDPKADRIHMPPIRTFHAMQGYYATLAHETVHWSGHPRRLDRLGRFADRAAYAFEELIAELGNVMLCAGLGLSPDFGQSGAYVESWLRALKEDKRAIFRAAAEALKAADYLRDLAGREPEREVA